MNEIAQVLWVSVLGMGITFAALIFIIVVISVLTRLFPPKPEGRAGAESAVGAVTASGVSEEEEAAVAIAVALGILRASRGDLGAALKSGRGAWWKANRTVPMTRRKGKP